MGQTFKVGDVVTWTSQAAGSWKTKTGVITEVWEYRKKTRYTVKVSPKEGSTAVLPAHIGAFKSIANRPGASVPGHFEDKQMKLSENENVYPARISVRKGVVSAVMVIDSETIPGWEMAFDQTTAAEFLPILQHFIATGELPE